MHICMHILVHLHLNIYKYFPGVNSFPNLSFFLNISLYDILLKAYKTPNLDRKGYTAVGSRVRLPAFQYYH